MKSGSINRRGGSNNKNPLKGGGVTSGRACWEDPITAGGESIKRGVSAAANAVRRSNNIQEGGGGPLKREGVKKGRACCGKCGPEIHHGVGHAPLRGRHAVLEFLGNQLYLIY